MGCIDFQVLLHLQSCVYFYSLSGLCFYLTCLYQLGLSPPSDSFPRIGHVFALWLLFISEPLHLPFLFLL